MKSIHDRHKEEGKKLSDFIHPHGDKTKANYQLQNQVSLNTTTTTTVTTTSTTAQMVNTRLDNNNDKKNERMLVPTNNLLLPQHSIIKRKEVVFPCISSPLSNSHRDTDHDQNHDTNHDTNEIINNQQSKQRYYKMYKYGPNYDEKGRIFNPEKLKMFTKNVENLSILDDGIDTDKGDVSYNLNLSTDNVLPDLVNNDIITSESVDVIDPDKVLYKFNGSPIQQKMKAFVRFSSPLKRIRTPDDKTLNINDEDDIDNEENHVQRIANVNKQIVNRIESSKNYEYEEEIRKLKLETHLQNGIILRKNFRKLLQKSQHLVNLWTKLAWDRLPSDLRLK